MTEFITPVPTAPSPQATVADRDPLLLRRIDAALVLVREELIAASRKFGPFMSAHEGFAVLLEEVDELWDDVKKNNPVNAAKEAIQVAAMATRFIVDLRPAVS